MNEENLEKLTINYLTQEQYNQAKENGELNENELYFTPEEAKEKYNSIVYKTTLTSNASSIKVENLDMVADGGEYEFILYHIGNVANDVILRFNNHTTDDYFNVARISLSTDSSNSGTITNNQSIYRKNNYFGGYTNSSTKPEYPAVMKGRIFFSHMTRKSVGVNLTHSVSVNTYHELTELAGTCGTAFDNLTSLEFSINDSNFQAGTSLIIRKTN